MTNTTLRLLQNAYKTALSSSITAIATSITVDDAPDFTVPAGKKIPATIDPKNNFRENIYIIAIAGNVLTVERGKPDYLGGASTANTHTGGAVLIISNHFEAYENLADCIDTKLDSNGGNPSTTFDLDLTGSAFRIRKDGNDMKFTDDTTSEVSLATLAAAAGTDTKVKVSIADTTAGMLQGKINAGDGLTETIGSPAGDETLDLSVDATELISGDYGLETSSNDFRVKLAATPGLEFSTGLKAKVKTSGGITLDSDGLSLTQAFNPILSFVAAEAITTDDAVAALPYQVEWFTQLTDANAALGDSNIRRKYYVKYIPKANESFTTTTFRAAEAVNGATTLGNLIISWQTESAGAPSGTAVTNGSVTISQATQRTWGTTQGSRTATHAGAVALTKGTTYYLVIECSATDATNYLNIGVNSSYDENYCTFTRGTYNLDTTTWGSTVTNATPFFWVNTLSGMGLVQTDANWGARTWNFIGFAKAGGAADASIDVYYDTVPDLTSLTPGSSYWLSTDVGAITTTAPDSLYTEATAPTAFTYRIGRAISSTSLKIERGQKRVLIREATSITASVTRQYVTWFKPERVKIDAAQDNQANNDAAVSAGYVTSGASNFSIGMTNINAGSSDLNASTSASIIGNGMSDYFTCAGSDFTNAGFTYTYTETADPAGLVAVLEATA